MTVAVLRVPEGVSFIGLCLVVDLFVCVCLGVIGVICWFLLELSYFVSRGRIVISIRRVYGMNLLYHVEIEKQFIYQRALQLSDEFINQAKPLRTGGNFSFYEPRVRVDKGETISISWVDVTIKRIKTGNYIPIIKHVSKGVGVFKYASNRFRKKSVEFELVLAYESEFAKIRTYGKSLTDLKKQIIKAEKIKLSIEE